MIDSALYAGMLDSSVLETMSAKGSALPIDFDP